MGDPKGTSHALQERGDSSLSRLQAFPWLAWNSMKVELSTALSKIVSVPRRQVICNPNAALLRTDLGGRPG